MSRGQIPCLTFALAGVLLIVAACTSQPPANITYEPVSLFDGSSLAGWKASDENPDSFSVQNGEIIANGPRAHLFYQGEYGIDFENFVLSMQVKTQQGANSGVYFHTAFQSQGWPEKGLEAQVNATHTDVRKTGSLYAVADIRVLDTISAAPLLGLDSNPYTTMPKPPHSDAEWFDYEIRVEHGVVTTRVNGRLMVRWKQPKDWNQGSVALSAGTFALQAHDPDSKVHFKDIVVQRLRQK